MSKFFIPLGFRYGKQDGDKDINSHVMLVFGPYKNETEVTEAIDRLKQYGNNAEFLVFDGDVFVNTPDTKESTPKKRRAGNLTNFTPNLTGGGYCCKACGALALAAQITRANTLEGSMAGDEEGYVVYSVPYCPNCDEKPE